MRLNTAGAVFCACIMVAAAIGIVASRALVPGFTRLTSDRAPVTSAGVALSHLSLLRGD